MRAVLIRSVKFSEVMSRSAFVLWICLVVIALVQTASAQWGQSYAENLKTCCQANGVSSRCIGLCKPKPSAKGFCRGKSNCESDIKIGQYCGLNGYDVRACCEEKRIPKKCRYFCDPNTFPSVGRLVNKLSCLKYNKEALDCAQRTYVNGQRNWGVRSWKSEKWNPYIKAAVKRMLKC